MSDLIKILLQAEISHDNIANIKSQINSIQSTTKPVKINVDTKNAISSLEKLEDVTKKNLSLDLDRLSNRYKNLIKPEDVSQIQSMIGALSHTDPKLGHNIDLIKVKMKEMSVGAEQNRRSLDLANKSAMSFGESIKQAALKFGIWSGVTVAYYTAVRAMKNGVITVKELDTAMVELKKVTDETEATYNKFTETAFKLGRELGRTGIEVVQATADFARMGYNIQQATALAEQALLMVNVGDGIDNIEEATSSMIATLKGFNVSSEDTIKAAVHINDAYNEIANNFATDTGNLADGVQRASAVLNQAGVSFNQTLGLLTGGDEVLQNMQKVATGLVTITQRLRGMGEDGEAIEGLAPTLEKAFGDIGITLVDTNGNLKDTYTVMSELAKIFPTLTSMQKAYISELTSGKRQAPVLQAIISNWESVEKATETAMNSANSALIENEKYLDSIEGKMAQLSSQTQLFWNTAINSDDIKNVIDVGTDFMEMLTNVVNEIGIFGGALNIIVPLLGVRYVWAATQATKATIQKQIADKALGQSSVSLASGFKLLIGQLFATKGAADAAKVSFTGLNIAAGIMTAGLTLIPIAINAIVTAEEKRKKAMEESLKVFQRQQRINDSMEELITNYKDLSENTKLTTEESQKLLDVKSQIKDLIPKSTAIIDNENLSLSEQVDILKSLNEEELKNAKIKAGENINKYGGDSLEKTKRDLEANKKALDNYHESIGKLIKKQSEGIELTTQEKNSYSTLSRAIDILNKGIAEKENKINLVEQSYKILNGELDNTEKSLNDINGAVGDTNSMFETQLKSLEQLTEEFEKVTDKLQSYYKILDELNSKEGLLAQSKQDIITKHKELLPYINNEQELREQLIAIIKKEEETQKQAYVNMLMYSEDFYNAKIKGNAELVESLNEYYQTDFKNFSSLADAKGKVEVELVRQLSGIWADYYDVVKRGNVNAMVALEQQAAQGSEGAQQVLDAHRKIAEMENHFRSISLDLGGIDFKGINRGSKGSSKSSSTEPYKATADAYLAIANAIAEVNNQLDKNKSKLSIAEDQDKINLLKQQNELYKEQQNNVHRLAQSYRLERTELEKYLSGQGFKFSGEGDKRYITNLGHIEGKTKEVEEAFNRYNDLVTKEIPAQGKDWLNLRNAIADVGYEIEFLKLDGLFKPAKDGVESLTKEMDLLEFKFKMIEDTNLDGKMDILSQKLINAKAQVGFLANELVHLKSVGFEGSSQAIDEYNKRLEDLEKQHMNAQLLVKSINDQMMSDYKQQVDKVQSEREKIADNIIKVIQDAYRKQREIVINTLNQQLKAEEKIHKRRIEMLDEQLSKYEEIIQAQLDAIDRQEDEDSFNKELKKMQDERAEIIKNINILSMDDSLEARNRVSDLHKKLTEQDQKIEEFKHKRTVDLRKQNLKDELNSYKKQIDEKKKTEENNFQATKDRIEREIQLEEWKFDKLINDEEYYAELRKDIISGNISEVNDLMIGFLDDFESYNESTIKGIESSWQDLLNQIHRIKEAQREIYNMPSEPSKPKIPSSSSSSPSSSSKSSSSSSGSSSSSSSSSSRTGGDPMRIPGTNKYIAEVKQPNGDWTTVLIEDGKVVDRHKLKDGSIIYTFGGAYRYDSKTNKGQILHDGGWVGNTKLKKDEIPAILQEGEYVLSKKMLENISNISKIKMPNPIIDIPKVSNASSNNPIEFKIGNLIKIEGNADEKILPELNRAADSVMDRLKKDLNMSGIYRPMKV